MKKKSQCNFFNVLVLFVVLTIFSQSVVYGQIIPTSEAPQTSSVEAISLPPVNHLLSSPVFNEDTQSTVIVNPIFDDNSTNVSFYIQCPSRACKDIGTKELPQYIFSAENLGHGSLPLSEYWAVPALTSYVAIEYKNDNQQFSCSNLTLDECLTNKRFIQRFNFKVVQSGVPITPAMTAGIEQENASSTSASDALRQLSISLSSSSISSNLENGLIVTASFDGIASIATSSIATHTPTNVVDETNEDSPPSSFLMDMVESVIGIFTNTETPIIESTTPELESATIVEIPLVMPTKEAETDIAAPLNEVQSPMSPEEVINNDITTTTF